MTHGPFGLSPQVLSIGFLVAFLGGGTLLSVLMSRRKTRVVGKRQPTQQAGQFPPPGYPSLPPPTHPYGELVGLWNFKSAVRWVGVWIGVIIGAGAVTMPLSVVLLPAGAFKNGDIAPTLLAAIASGAVGLLLIVYSVWRPSRAVQHCNVDHRLAITVMRGGREIPLDLNHYRYVRMHVTVTSYNFGYPSMLVFNRDSPPGIGTLLSSMLFPRVDEGRVVLLYSNWRTADGALIPMYLLDDFFLDICRRAGYEPHFRRTWFAFGRPGWDVRADRQL